MNLNTFETKINKGEIDKDDIRKLLNYAFRLQETNEEIKEQYKILESGNKQVLEEYRVTFAEKLRYWKIIEWIKGQYDADFTKEEIQQLEPRDSCIYETIEKVLK